jgi:arylsulfatase A-like enzyme
MRWLLLPLLAGCAAPPPAMPERPNFIVILADDLGVNDLGSYGRKDHRTPRLDRLASEGVRFTRAYCAQPICSPSRAAILTGLHPARLHLTTYLPGRADLPSQKLLHPKILQQLPLERTTLAEALAPAGYASAALGKWHLGGGPEKQGFGTVSAGKSAPGTKGEADLTERAIEFLRKQAGGPFLLYLAHHTPHIPLTAPAALVAKHRDAYNPVYAAMMELMDDAVGRVLDEVDRLGLRERTVVVFLSDNGGLHVPELKDDAPTHNTPFRAGKGFVYEGGLRIPMIVRGPGLRSGQLADFAASQLDLFPTLLDFAGVSMPGPGDGRSLAGWLRGDAEPPPRPLYWHYPHYTNQGSRPAGAVIDGDWKLIEHYEDRRVELYHLGRDPGEREDCSGRYGDRAEQLRSRLAAWRTGVGAQENLPAAAFREDLHRALYVDTDVSRIDPPAKAAELTPKLREWRTRMDAKP